MRGHTSTGCQDTLGHSHTRQILGRGLDTHHHHTLAIGVPLSRILGEEYNLAGSCAWRGGQTLHEQFGLLLGHLVEHGVEQLVQLVRLDAVQTGLLVDHALMQQVDSDLHHGRTRALAVAGLQEPKLTFLHGELHILHIVVVLLQLLLDAVQLAKDIGHSLLH